MANGREASTIPLDPKSHNVIKHRKKENNKERKEGREGGREEGRKEGRKGKRRERKEERKSATTLKNERASKGIEIWGNAIKYTGSKL